MSFLFALHLHVKTNNENNKRAIEELNNLNCQSVDQSL